MIRLKPLNDVVFKKLFGENHDKDLLIGFLNSILSIDIEDLLVQEEKLSIETIEDKQGILDIKAFCNTGEKINVEVQLANPYNMVPRTLFYWSKLYCEGFRTSDNYRDLTKTITINILDYNLLPHQAYHSSYRLYEDHSKELLTDLIEIHFIEYPKFNSVEYDVCNPLHRWLLFLKEDVPDTTLQEVVAMDHLLKKANEKLMYLSADDEIRRIYELREKNIADEKSRIQGAKEEGKKEGEELKSIEIAKNLIKLGLSISEISSATGLPNNKIIELKNK